MESSNLFRLSPELRNQIYEHVFTSKYAVTLQYTKCQHALTQTCRQLRLETLAMYYSLTSFNAHLDDGPTTPLTNWLKVLGPETACEIDRINVWDLHMLQCTLHGPSATKRIFLRGSIDSKWHPEDNHNDLCNGLGPRNHKPERKHTIILRPIDIRSADPTVKPIFLALHSMGLGLARFLLSHADAAQQERLTSEYAIVPLQSTLNTNPCAIEDVQLHNNNNNTNEVMNHYSQVDTLQKQLELSDAQHEHMQMQLSDGERTVTIREQRRVLVLEFDPSGTRLVDLRQAAMSEASHDMLHSVVGAMRNWRAIP